MMKNLMKMVLAVVCTFGGFAMVATAASATSGVTASVKHPTYALGNAKHCKTGYAKMIERHKVTVRVKVHGTWRTEKVSRRYLACVYVGTTKIIVSSPTVTIPVATVTTPVVTAPVGSAIARATIDPAYAQNPANPLDVTFTYSAGESQGPLATGVLNLFWGTAQSQTLACSLNVGGPVTGGTCEVIFPAYGQEVITVQYVSGSISATQSETDDIENPTPPTTTTTTTVPAPLATTTSLGIVSGSVSNGFVFGVQVTDANGLVALPYGSVVLTITASHGYVINGQWTATTISDGQSSCTLLVTDVGGFLSLTSSNCTVSGPSGAFGNAVNVTAQFTGEPLDLASRSFGVTYP